ncbi:DUF202 domain-containing protein [Brevibacterium sp. 50QC2O2]|uniref:DUF202 domain-containing protein n=1 Tax=Brevibacterium TaxID=1696 RepID=UPI00211C3F31|nr:DUF202 domain-containing protein [Brevibacterium sp. 68QC2CO]MCQ9388666.1 DUF202 domain-containing protein [Brevibacterium sp. 50QC2O2]
MKDPRPHQDLGLQPERTALAWTRTTVSFLVAAAILLKWTGNFGWPILVLVAGLAITGLLVLARQRIRYTRGARGIVGGRVRPNLRAVITLTCCLWAIGIAELVLLLLSS